MGGEAVKEVEVYSHCCKWRDRTPLMVLLAPERGRQRIALADNTCDVGGSKVPCLSTASPSACIRFKIENDQATAITEI